MAVDTEHQLNLFGGSVQARYRELLGLPAHMPENGYVAEYLIEFAQAQTVQPVVAPLGVANQLPAE